MNYSIVKANGIPELLKAVNEMIDKGYEPIGGMVVQYYPTLGEVFYQTMYKQPVCIPTVWSSDTTSTFIHPFKEEPVIVSSKEPSPQVVETVVECTTIDNTTKKDKRKKNKQC